MPQEFLHVSVFSDEFLDKYKFEYQITTTYLNLLHCKQTAVQNNIFICKVVRFWQKNLIIVISVPRYTSQALAWKKWMVGLLVEREEPQKGRSAPPRSPRARREPHHLTGLYSTSSLAHKTGHTRPLSCQVQSHIKYQEWLSNSAKVKKLKSLKSYDL